MKVLFAVSNDNVSASIIKKYQEKFKEIITSKNVYYFNAIIKELQKDKTYDAVVIGEDLEPISNNNYDTIDKFIFDKLDNISDEAYKTTGEDIPIILICSDRRTKSDELLIKLFGIGIYNALLGNDRNIDMVCNLISKPRSKKEAKNYYKIDSEDVNYKPENESEVSETEIKNILNHYKKIGNNEKKCIESFESIAAQYNDTQLRIITKFLPNNVKAILEKGSDRYQKLVNGGTVLSRGQYSPYTPNKKEVKKSDMDFITKDIEKPNLTKPVIIPSTMNIEGAIQPKQPAQVSVVQRQSQSMTGYNAQNPYNPSYNMNNAMNMNNVPQQIPQNMGTSSNMTQNIETQNIVQDTEKPEAPSVQPEVAQVKRRGRPKKIVTEQPVVPETVQPVKRGRGRPRKNVIAEDLEQNSATVNEPIQQTEQTISNNQTQPENDVGTLNLFDLGNDIETPNTIETPNNEITSNENLNDEGINLFGMADDSNIDTNINQQNVNSTQNLNEQQNSPYNQNINEMQNNPYNQDMWGVQNNPYNQDISGMQNNPYNQDMGGMQNNPYNQDMGGMQNNPYNQDINGMQNNPYNQDISGQQNNQYNEYQNSAQNNTDFFGLENSQEMTKVKAKSNVIPSDFVAQNKIVAFVGTSKNGTSFIVNNLAELLAQKGVKTAILDLTKNRNSYYMFTDNDQRLMQIASQSIKNLEKGLTEGLEVNKNLSVYTALPDDLDESENFDAILQTLDNNYSAVLIDCDFDTNINYFVKATEIYLVQSMDALTIQPLTQFLSELKLKNALDESKLRVVINKEMKLKILNDKMILGGMAKYNEPSMTLQRDLFNPSTIKYTTIPFEMQTYARYLEAIALCQISLSGYSQTFLNSLEKLASMVYPLVPGGNNYSNYSPNYEKAAKKGFFKGKNKKQPQTQFSAGVNGTLDKMRANY